MKNIHILPTDKPSRLWKNNLLQGILVLNKDALPFNTAQNIYITSDEEIKERCHVFNTKSNHYGGVVNKNNLSDARLLSYIKKIILTDNKELIKDGVQAIDDEFLQWFVKNPSCEEVEIKSDWEFLGDDYRHGGSQTMVYKIIIPQEEPKQDAINYSLNAFKVPKEYFGKEDPNYNMKQEILDEMKKQETLEEAINSYIYKTSKEQKLSEILENAIRFGAKWQQEQDKNKFSERDFKQIVCNIVGELACANNMTFNGAILDELFNKFKKK